jgi:hypothetical protein
MEIRSHHHNHSNTMTPTTPTPGKHYWIKTDWHHPPLTVAYINDDGWWLPGLNYAIIMHYGINVIAEAVPPTDSNERLKNRQEVGCE